MIDDALITRVFENIIDNGTLVNVTSKNELIFKVGEFHATIIISNETEGDDKITNTPLSVDKLIKWYCPWEWSVHKAIKPGILLIYQIHTAHNNYIVKPKLSKQEEYKEKINKHLYDYEIDYLAKLLSI